MANRNRFLITLILPFLLAVVASSTMSSVCISRYNHTNTNPSTTQDTFQTNLQTLFGEFRTNSSSIYGHSVAGKSPNQAYGLYLCRGDTTSDRCSTCVASLTEWVNPSDGCKEAFAYTDDCMIHFANYSFLGKENNTAPGEYSAIEFWKLDAANFGEYNRTVAGVVEGLVAEVGNISAALTLRYGTREGRVGGDGREKVYGLAQCTPDISQRDCSGCLKAAFSAIQGCCGGGKYAWAMLPSCQLRYDNASFYSSATANSLAVSATFPLVASWALFSLFLINCLFC